MLVGNDVGDEGSKALGQALGYNRTLTELVLADNNITDRGTKALVKDLKNNANTALQRLNLSVNFITDEGAKYLASSAKVSNLTSLFLDQNLICESQCDHADLRVSY